MTAYVGQSIGSQGLGDGTYLVDIAEDKRALRWTVRWRHQEKYSKIVIDYKAVTKTGMTGIYCNGLGAVDIAYNPIIIISQPLSLL